MPLSPLTSHLVLFIALPILAVALTYVVVGVDRWIDARRRTPICAHGYRFDACPVSWGNHLSDEHAPDEVCKCDGFVFECLSVTPGGLTRRPR